MKKTKTQEVIKFSCQVSCGGKCCTGATHVLASEIKGVMHDVPITPMLIAMRGSRFPKTFIPRLKTHGIMVKAESEHSGKSERFYIFLDFIMGAMKNTKECIFLKEGLCSIQDSKPLKCSLLPVHPLIPQEWMGKGYKSMKNNPNCIGFDPHNGIEPEVVYEKGMLKSIQDKNNINRYFEEIGKQTKFLEKLLAFDMESSAVNNDKSLFGVYEFAMLLIDESLNSDSAAQQKTGEFSMPAFELDVMSRSDDFKYISDAFVELTGVSIKEFASAQLEAFEKYRDYDIQAWENTKALQRQEEDYSRIIEEV